jgi:glycosyltransferase involved in cell wall biosynthesis
MRVAVISQIRPGCSRAHAINVIKTAGGFERLGHEVTVYCVEPEPGHAAAPGAAYREDRLAWRFAPAETDDAAFGRWAAEAARDADFVYARNFWGPLLTARAGVPTVLESHAYAGTANPLLDRCLRTPGLDVVTIGEVLRTDFIARGADPARVRIVPDGVDFEMFDSATPRDFGPGGPHIVYAGHLYDYKGIPTILDAARLLPRCRFHLVGGLASDVDRVRRRVVTLGLANVQTPGRVPHAAVPQWTRGADVLLLPPSGGEPSRDWTSPVKLGEYLASGPPMVVSRIPALVAALGREPVEWFAPDDGESLAAAIGRAVADSADAAGRARRRDLARALSFPARARRILEASQAGARSRDARAAA